MHFPIAFPEVFLGRSQGFNVILGNPPWEEAVVNEDKFWATQTKAWQKFAAKEKTSSMMRLRGARPDLMAELAAELATTKLLRFSSCWQFPGHGTGDPDLYKAFAWRFWTCFM